VTTNLEEAGIGEEVKVRATIYNSGDADSPRLEWRTYYSIDATITPDDQLGTAGSGVVPAGQSRPAGGRTFWPQLPGTRYYGTCYFPPEDSGIKIACSRSVVIVVRLSDLVVQSPSVSDSSLETSEQFTLSATVKNAGRGKYVASTYDHPSSKLLRYYRSIDSAISDDDWEVGTDSVGTIPASGTEANSIDLPAPSAPGGYYYYACMDPVVKTPAPLIYAAEANTANNCSSTVKVDVEDSAPGTPRPNLQVGTPSVDDSSPETGASFTLSLTVTNAGDGESTAATLRYYRSTDSTIVTTDTQVGTDEVGALAASGSSSETISLIAPATNSGVTYYYGACIDAVEGESDTSDNCSSAVKVDVEAIWDPIVYAPEVRGDRPGAGDSFTFRVIVWNNPDYAPVAAVTVRFYRSTDATITTSDTEVATAQELNLAPDDYRFPEVTLTAPTTAGTYYYGACLDTVPGEKNTANNCMWDSEAITIS